MNDTVWSEFFRNKKFSDRTRTDQFIYLWDFLSENFETLLNEELSNFSRKTRISAPNSFFHDVKFDIRAQIKKALVLSERVVITPAPPLTCKSISDRQFASFTCDWYSFFPVRSKRGELLTIGTGFEFLDLDWILEAEELLTSGKLNYIPFISPASTKPIDGANNEYGHYHQYCWHPTVFSLPEIENATTKDQPRWQAGSVALDWMVAKRLNANQILPTTLLILPL